MVAGADSEAASPALVLACFVAIGFIVATSLALTNAAGLSAHSRKGGDGDGEYTHQGAAADRLRPRLRGFPYWVLRVFYVFACMIVASFFMKWAPSIMVGFAVTHITIVVSSMSAICRRALAVAAGDRDAGRGPPPPP